MLGVQPSFKPSATVLNLIKVLVSITLLYFVFRDINLSTLFSQLAQTSPAALTIYLFISILLVLLASYRWAILVLDTPTSKDVMQFFKANLSALFYNLFLPTAYGGDLVKWTQLESLQIGKRTLILSVLADRIVGVMGLITVGFFASLFTMVYNLVPLPPAISLLFIFLFFGLVVCLIIIFSPLQFRQLPFLSKLGLLQQLDDYLLTRKLQFFKMYTLAIIIQIISFSSFYLLAIEAKLGISFLYFLTISPVIALISVLPVSVAGFGTTEAAYLYFFEQLGANKGNILVFTSLFGLFKILLGGIGWITDFMVTSKRIRGSAVKK